MGKAWLSHLSDLKIGTCHPARGVEFDLQYISRYDEGVPKVTVVGT